MVFRSSFVAAVCSAAALLLAPTSASHEELCSLAPYSYASAKQSHPDVAFAISEIEKHSIATWYSDRNADYTTVTQRLVDTCPESSRLSVVVYGLPKKDCEAGYSSSGQVQSASDYVQFLQRLLDTIKDRKVLYVLEPDAVGLLAKDGGCGEAAGYRDNLKTAIQMLSTNPNADIYLDVGYWSLAYPEPRQRVVEVIQNLISSGGRVKGITLNTSNYRKTSEMADLCSAFQNDMSGAAQMNCVVDTSRNYRGSPSSEWCNVGTAGIGEPPSGTTGISNIDYFLWIKPPGESDGVCDSADHTADSLRGPSAGEFFVDGFKKLWDYGYFVDAMNMAKFDGAIHQTPMPDGNSVVQTGVPSTPEPTTTTPTTEPTTTTPAPEPTMTTSAPDATIPTPETTTPAPEPTTTTSTPVPEPTATTPAPVLDNTVAPTETPASSAPTESPSVVPTETPSVTTSTPDSEIPVMTLTPSAGSTSGSSVGSPSVELPTPHPSFRPTNKPTKTPTAPPSSSNDMVQNTLPAQDGGPSTIGGNPDSAKQANTKSGDGSASATGGIIAAVLIAAVALAVAAAMFIHVRRRAQDATADEMKTPVSMDPAHPAYLSQL